MNLAQRLVGLTVLVLTISVIGFTTLPRNIGKDAVWGAGYSMQQLHLVGGALLPQGGELRISHIARGGKALLQVVKVPAGQARELATLGITLPAPPADTITEISLFAEGTEVFRSVPVISGTTNIVLQPVPLLSAMNMPFVCSAAAGKDRVSLSMDAENNAVALHRESKGDGTDLPSFFAVSANQWDSETGQSLIVDADGSLKVLERDSVLSCSADTLWGAALPVRQIAQDQYFYADIKTVVFFDSTSKPISMPVLRSVTESSWRPEDSSITMTAESDAGISTLAFTVEDCATSNTWGLRQLKMVQDGPSGIVTQACSGRSLDPFAGTWTGAEWQGEPIKAEVFMELTDTDFTVENPCAVYSGKLAHSSETPFDSATLDLANRRAKAACTGEDSTIDIELAKAFSKGLRLEPNGSRVTLRPVNTATGHDPKLVFSRNQSLGT